jgi:hypothetical protein
MQQIPYTLPESSSFFTYTNDLISKKLPEGLLEENEEFLNPSSGQQQISVPSLTTLCSRILINPKNEEELQRLPACEEPIQNLVLSNVKNVSEFARVKQYCEGELVRKKLQKFVTGFKDWETQGKAEDNSIFIKIGNRTFLEKVTLMSAEEKALTYLFFESLKNCSLAEIDTLISKNIDNKTGLAKRTTYHTTNLAGKTGRAVRNILGNPVILIATGVILGYTAYKAMHVAFEMITTYIVPHIAFKGMQHIPGGVVRTFFVIYDARNWIWFTAFFISFRLQPNSIAYRVCNITCWVTNLPCQIASLPMKAARKAWNFKSIPHQLVQKGVNELEAKRLGNGIVEAHRRWVQEFMMYKIEIEKN